MYIQKTSMFIGILIVVVTAQAAVVRGQYKPQEGMWRGWLDSPGGELPFTLEWVSVGPIGWDVWIHNGAERAKLTGAVWNRRQVVITIDHYDAMIVARVSEDGAELNGTWQKRSGATSASQLPFHAVFDETQRFLKPRDWKGPDQSVSGRWAVRFESDKNPAVGSFEQDGEGNVRGTFLTATGDYRYLEGDFDGTTLRLSTFDGAHAFLFRATLGEDGTLSGDFWSRDNWHEKWSGRRDVYASLRDPLKMNRTVTHVNASELAFRDLDGNARTLSDPQFHSKLILLEVFGSWCPNCHDAAEFLVELDRRYRDVGLSIVGLAYELTGDFQRDARQVQRFKERHKIEYPLMLAGTSDKDEARKTLPFLDRLIAYPTLILLDGEYRIKAVHTGFSGPATGFEYEKLKKNIHDLIGDALLRPKKPWEE